MGDFKVDLSQIGVKSNNLSNMMKSHGLENEVKSYTKEQKGSKSLINCEYTDLPDRIFYCNVLITALSDHHAQISVVKQGNDSSRYLFTRFFKDENMEIFQKLLQR